MADFKYNEALSILDELLNCSNSTKEDRIECFYYKSKILVNLGFFEKSIYFANSALVLGKDILHLSQKLQLRNILIENLWHLGRIEESLVLLADVEKEMEELSINAPDYSKIKSKILLNKSSIYSYLDLTKATTIINSCLNLLEKDTDENLLSYALFMKARIEMYKGDLQNAVKTLNLSYKLGQKTGNILVLSRYGSSLGEIYRLQGLFGKALQHYNDALMIYQQLGNLYGIAVTYNNVGIVHYSKNSLNLSYDYFEKSLDYAKQINFRYIMAESIYYLISIHLIRDEIDEAKKYLELSEKVSASKKGTMIFYYTLLSQSIILKATKRLKTLGKAQEILETIIKENSVYNEINIHAMLNLSEILLYELRITEDQMILNELSVVINKLQKIAEGQLSSSLLAETLWLKARLSLVKGNVSRARDLLYNAQSIAEEQKLENLAQKISDEHDQLLRQLKNWKELIKENTSLKERIDASQVDNLVYNMITRATFELETIEKDDPVMLLILDINGIPKFSLQFENRSSQKIDDLLITGFLSAINNILREVFSTDGVIKRIEHQDYLLLFKNIEPLLFCYVFTGSSYSASKKLDDFANDIASSSLWNDLLTSIRLSQMINAKTRLKLEEMADKSFGV